MTTLNYYIKTNRSFTKLRKYSWIFTLMVAIGGLWEPKLGLLVFLVMASLLVTAFFNGRYWCGNVCPHGSLFDNLILPVSRNKSIPAFLKSKWFILGFFVFFMFNFSRKILKAFTFWGTYDFLDKLGFVMVGTYLVVLIVGGLLALFAAPRTWCQFCPMGSMQKASHALGKLLGVAKKTEKKITVSSQDKCHKCGKCSRVCPVQLAPYQEFSGNNQFDNINCIKCATCVNNCPAGILSLENEKSVLKLKDNTSLTGYENRQRIHAKIVDIKELKPDFNEYTFSFISPEKVPYQAGQFILVKIQDEPEVFRAYSISSYNENDSRLSIIIKKVADGYGTNIIFDKFKIGDEIVLEGPLGNHLVPDPTAEKILFIGNGIGITPFIALVKDVLLNHKKVNEVKLLDGQKYENEFLYADYFKNLAGEYEHFTYVPVVSRDKESSLRKGYVTDVLKEWDVSGYKVYMCGTKNMIEDSRNILLNNGVKEEDISSESQ